MEPRILPKINIKNTPCTFDYPMCCFRGLEQLYSQEWVKLRDLEHFVLEKILVIAMYMLTMLPRYAKSP